MSQNEGMCKSVSAAESAYTWSSGDIIVRCWKTEHNRLRWRREQLQVSEKVCGGFWISRDWPQPIRYRLISPNISMKKPAQIVTLHVHVWSEGWKQSDTYGIRSFNHLRPHDALKHHFTSLKTHLIFLQIRALEWKSPCNWLINTWQFCSIFKPNQIIFIHYKSRIAWMKMTTVNSGLKGLIDRWKYSNQSNKECVYQYL